VKGHKHLVLLTTCDGCIYLTINFSTTKKAKNHDNES